MLTWKATFRTFLNFLNSSFESFTETTGKVRCEKRELEVTLYFKISIVVILLREHCHCHINVFKAHSFITFFFRSHGIRMSCCCCFIYEKFVTVGNKF